MIDVVIPAHKKDIDTLELCIEGIRKNVESLNRIIVVSNNKLTDKAEWHDEKKFPFSFNEVGDILGNIRKVGWNAEWYYKQLLKLTAHESIDDLLDDYLIVDSDTIFLKKKKFIDDGTIYFDVTHTYDAAYYECMSILIDGLDIQTEYSGVVHHMLFSRSYLEELKSKVVTKFNMPFWMSVVTGCGGGEGSCRLSEYELYFHYILKYHRDNIKISPRKSILAYKGRLGVEGENLIKTPYGKYRGGSRTNMHGERVQIIPKEEEELFSFKTFKEAIIHVSSRCKELGWDAVTFQNHTREKIE